MEFIPEEDRRKTGGSGQTGLLWFFGLLSGLTKAKPAVMEDKHKSLTEVRVVTAYGKKLYLIAAQILQKVVQIEIHNCSQC